jgi:hypothetical protein
MYDEDGNRRFSILRMIFICLIIAFFVFLVMWAIAKSKQSGTSCTDKSNTVFNSNINYLQQVGTDYFTTDKLPTEIGQTIIITLEDLVEGHYILQINDSDGKTCNMNESYVSVTKTETGYEMKTYLVCGDREDYVIKVLGCHDLCNNTCNTCSPTLTEYEYKKTISTTTTTYSCPKGYTKNNKTCSITKVTDTKKPTENTTTTVDIKKANQVVVAGTKTKVDTKSKKEPLKVEITKNKEPLKVEKTKHKEPLKVEISTTPDKVETVCTTTYKTETYNCNCTTYRDAYGRSVTTCSTCKRTIPVEHCEDVVTPGSKMYKCPNGTDEQTGSGENLKCYKYTYTYKCPNGTDEQTGSEENLRCYKYTYTYKCPTGTDEQTGSGTNLKCYKKDYYCPSNSNYSEGSGKNLKCYVVTGATFSYNCNGYSGYTLSGTNCVKTTTVTTKTCDKGYKLEGNKCNKYSTTTIDATAKQNEKKDTKYTWSKETTLEGWTRTGKTRTVKNTACNK